MRFNSDERFVSFQEKREYPKIHDDIFQMVLAHCSPTTFCDLCCSTGLLGQRLEDAGFSGFGVDGDESTIAKAKEAGVSMPLFVLPVNRGSLSKLRALLVDNFVEVLVARRCLSEIFYPDNFGGLFSSMLHDLKITKVFVQGRRPVKNPTHPIHSVALEIACLGPSWRVVWTKGELAYLEAK